MAGRCRGKMELGMLKDAQMLCPKLSPRACGAASRGGDGLRTPEIFCKKQGGRVFQGPLLRISNTSFGRYNMRVWITTLGDLEGDRSVLRSWEPIGTDVCYSIINLQKS